jgi:3-oxoacyl-(acyl-carrier-protein) synthase
MSAALLGFGRVSAAGLQCGKRLEPWASGPLALKAGMFSDTPFPRFGRMDPLCKVAVAAASLALRDAGARVPDGAEIAQAGGTGHGCVLVDGTYEDSRAKGAASPASFVYTLPSMYLGEIAIRFGLRGRCALLTGGPLAGLSALVTGVRWLEQGRASAVLVTAAEAVQGTRVATSMLLARDGGGRFAQAAFRVPPDARLLDGDDIGVLYDAPPGVVGARAAGQEFSLRVLDARE